MKRQRFSLAMAFIAVAMVLMACSTEPLAIEQVQSSNPNIEIPTPAISQDVGSVVFADSELRDSLVTTAVSGNLLTNGEFETNLNGWTACASAANLILSTDMHAGATAGEISGDCFFQSVPVNAGDEVSLSCYAKQVSGTWSGMGMGFSDSGWATLADAPTVTISSATYALQNTTAIAPANTSQVSVWLSTDGVARIDECSVVVDSAPAPVSNLLLNPSFEMDTANWYSCGASLGTIVGNPITDGAKALNVNNACAYQTLQATPDTEYTLSCDAQGGTAAWSSMTLRYIDSGWATITEQVVPVNSATMQPYTVSLMSPSNTAHVAVTFYSEDDTTFDNCVLMPEAGTTAPEPTDPEPTDPEPTDPEPTDPPVNNTCIGDTVFSDTNNNGVQDAGELGIAGVTINLYAEELNNADGVFNNSDVLFDTQTTDTNGNYKFCGLDAFPQFYVIALTDTANVLTGYTATTSPLLSHALSVDQFIENVDFGFHNPDAFVAAPAIDISKNAEGDDSQNIDYGAAAPFTIMITNTGNVDLTNVVVSDPMTIACDKQFASLAIGETQTYTCEHIDVNSDFVNTATVTAEHSGTEVSDEDKSIVVVGPAPQPAIDIRKNDEGADTISIDYDGTALYRVTIKNVGNVDLTNIEVSDPDKTNCASQHATLAVGEIKSYTCQQVNVTAGFTNTATVTAKYEDTVVQDQDISEVVVGPAPQPSIDIRKQGEGPDTRTFDYGDRVGYTIVVTNTGNVDLKNVKVVDPTKALCARDIGALAAGEDVTYSCILANVTDDLTNSAVVTGDYDGETVSDSDSSSIVVLPAPDPKIDIRKEVEGPDSKDIEYGKNVIYTINVRNIGNVALTNVVVTDNGKANCYNAIGNLAVGQVVEYTCVLNNITTDLTNTATVTGKYKNQTVTDSDQSSVKIIVRNGSIGNSVWWDDNKNGLIDSDEVGIKDVTVHLIKTNNNGTYIKTTKTNSSGTYYFNNVAPGEYKVKVILPSGTRATTKDAGNDSKDSDINSDGKTGAYTLGNGQHLDHIDAGLVYTMYEEHDANLMKNFHGRYDYKVIGASENYREDRYDCRDRGDRTVHLSIPSGAKIAGAYLYWSGSGHNDSHVYLNGSSVNSQQKYDYYLPNGYWSGNYYGNVSDVTSKVHGSGSYKVSGLSWSNASNYCDPNSAYGVWSMVVVYEQDHLPVSSVNVYKSFEKSWPASNWSFDIDKLADNHCARTAKVTHISYEGDHYKGEDLWINNKHMGNNTYNGSAGPNLDIDTHTVNIAANQSSIKFKTSSYATNTIFGNAIEFAINGGFVAKTNSCSTLKPN